MPKGPVRDVTKVVRCRGILRPSPSYLGSVHTALITLYSILVRTDRHDADASAENLRAAWFLAIGSKVERVYGCQGFAATGAYRSVLVFNLWENCVRRTTGQ